MPVGTALAPVRQAWGTGQRDDVRRLSEDGRRGRPRSRLLAENAEHDPRAPGRRNPFAPPCAAHGGLLRARRARRLHPCAARLRRRLRRGRRRARPGRGERRPLRRRSASSCASAAKAARTTRRSCWSRRCPAISPRCCAARSAPCCATIRCSSPTGTTRATCALEDGGFALEDYTQHLIDFVNFIGEDCHIVAVCQPTVSALVATAVMARTIPTSSRRA